MVRQHNGLPRTSTFSSLKTECVTVCDKRGPGEVFKFRFLRWKDYCGLSVWASKIESVLKSGRGRQNRRSERQDERKTPPTPFLALKMEQGKGTWAIREIISTGLWRHQKDMYLMITMHQFFFKPLKVHKCSFFQMSIILLVFCFNWCWDDKYSGPSLFKDSVFVSSSLAKIYDTQISTHCAFVHVCGHMQSDIWVPRDSCYQLTLHQLILCLLLLGCKQMSFPWSLSVTIFMFVLGDFDI